MRLPGRWNRSAPETPATGGRGESGDRPPKPLLGRALERADAVVLTMFHLAFAVGVLFLLAELLTRILLPDPTLRPHVKAESEAYAGDEWRQRFLEDRSKPGGEFVYDPYSEWRHGDKSTGLINVRNGLRTTWGPPPDARKKGVSVFAFGASTMYSIEVPDGLTIASLVAKRLNAQDPERRYLVRNYGVSGFTVDNEVHLLLKLLAAGERPDLVFFYDGLNEIQVKVALGRPQFFTPDFRAALFRVPLLRDYAKGIAVKLAVRSRLLRYLGPSPRHLAHMTFPFIEDPDALRANADAMLRNYEGYAGAVRALGEVFGFRSLFFWQASLYSTGKVLTAQEQSIKAWTDDYLPGLRLANEVTARRILEQRFFERTGVIDVRGALDDLAPTTFVDENHVTAAGNTAVAAALSVSLLAELRGERSVARGTAPRLGRASD